MPDNSPNAEIAQRTFDEGVDELNSQTAEVLDITKIRISVWDKLVILDAGTLALSFSATSTFAGRLVGDGGVGFMLAAWKLLMISIGLAVGAQLLAVGGAIFMRRRLVASKAHQKLIRAKEFATRNGLQLSPAQEGLVHRMEVEDRKCARYARPMESCSQIIGLAAVSCLMLAFYWLYRFARLNLGHF